MAPRIGRWSKTSSWRAPWRSCSSGPVVRGRLKVEINTREHFTVHGFVKRPLRVANPWFSGSTEVTTYSMPELLGTKLRALYQRKRGRDLLDLDLALEHPEFDAGRLLSAFDEYMAFVGASVTRAQFEANMAAKVVDEAFIADVPPLLSTGSTHDVAEAWQRVTAALISHLPGDPWKGDDPA